MPDNSEKINQLFTKLRVLMEKHQDFSNEIKALRDEIYLLKNAGSTATVTKTETVKEIVTEVKQAQVLTQVTRESVTPKQVSKPKVKSKSKTDFEKFIGENLINKIGIAITIIGVAIGAQYSIENDLISPLTRIILGYLSGVVLLGFGMKLKQKYEKYSAVLVSGAIMILYFITFTAYGFYGLMPKTVAFALMLVFTAFSVFAAIQYKRQIIAHLGLVGAYAVPFLLSNNSGNVTVLFTYMAIINIGILLISVRQYWKSLYYSAFIFTWAIYIGWFADNYLDAIHFNVAVLFAVVFFLIFYATTLAYKLVKKEKFNVSDVALLLLNSFIFFGVGITILASNEDTENLLGMFTVCNAIIHAVVSAVIYKLKLADRNLLYLIAGLVMVFITIAVPIQLDGNWVTFIWMGEAVLLYWLGKNKNIGLYEKLSYPIMALAFVSLLQDWDDGYHSYYSEGNITTIFNIHFLTSVLCIVGFGVINYVQRTSKNNALDVTGGLFKIVSLVLPVALLSILYFTFYLEIDTFWGQLFTDSSFSIMEEGRSYETTHYDYDLRKYADIWLINYTILFFSVLSFVNIKKLKNEALGFANIVFNTLSLLALLAGGLFLLSELRDNYLTEYLSEYYNRGVFSLVFRYVCYVFVGLILWVNHTYIRQDFIKKNLKIVFEIILYGTILWLLSSELLHWMHVAGSAQAYKLGLSILWGVYALTVISIGIWKKKQHLRIGGMVVFGVALVKLFAYDISHLNTISKIIVLVSLGVLLLIISFLYNKYKIQDAQESQDLED